MQLNQSATDLSNLSESLREMFSIFMVSSTQNNTLSPVREPKNLADLMAWKSSYELGIREINEQHKKLIALINK